MAKKKQKNRIKLNNRIREIFDGMPFDEGVATLPDSVLMELALVAGLEPDALDRPTLIRALRRLWSDGEYAPRKNIVTYLGARHGQALARSREAEAARQQDTVTTILSLLEPLGATPEEEQAILDHFVAVRPGKITAQKVQNTLHYLRLNARLRRIEEALEVEITPQGEMLFYHPFRFVLPEYDFTKTLMVQSEGLAMERRMAETADDAAIIAPLRLLREERIAARQEAIDRFVAGLFVLPHPWLSAEQIEAHLRRLPVEGDLLHNPIDFMVCEAIVHRVGSDYRLLSLGDHYRIEKEKTIGIEGITIPYRVSITYDKALFHAMIWQGRPLPFAEEFSEVEEKVLADFHQDLDRLHDEAKALASGLDVDDDVVWQHILPFLEPQLIASGDLAIKPKTHRRILYHFGEHLRPLREKKKREELLANTIRDFKQLFPLARERKRRIVFYAGPTNSGKTYRAMEHLRAAQTGYYLAPLRLLALEGYESLREHGVHASLITGEEEIIDARSTHISSTIEMLNFEADVACCVIDEIQMIGDRDRGWAWANALIGAPAQTVILTGSTDAIDAVRRLAEYLGEPLDVIETERKNPLTLLPSPVPLKRIEPLTAIVAFSRKEVLSLRQRLSPRHRVSVVYGNLSPEVRREEARKFREGQSDVLVATDAIAMGLNLPIRTLLFARDNKFDGLRRRELTTTEILQIAGRAGRYGLHEEGLIGALDAPTLETIRGKFYAPLPRIEAPFTVMASLHHVMLIGSILETEDLLEILSFFADNMEFEGPFRAANIESMLEIAEIVGAYELDLQARYHLSTAPVGINSPYIESVFHRYLRHLERQEPVPYLPPRDLPEYAHTHEELLGAEDRVKEVSLYLWLGFRFPEQFADTDAARQARSRLNRFIETSLAKGDFVKRCRRCGAPLDLSYRFSICETCYRKGKTGVRRGGRRRSDPRTR